SKTRSAYAFRPWHRGNWAASGSVVLAWGGYVLNLFAVALVVYIVLSLALFGVAVSTLWWMLHAWRTPVVLQETGFSGRSEQPDSSFSLIVPARHEQAVLGATLRRLAEVDHPYVEILAVVGHDDPATRAVAEAAARLHHDRIRVVIDH